MVQGELVQDGCVAHNDEGRNSNEASVTGLTPSLKVASGKAPEAASTASIQLSDAARRAARQATDSEVQQRGPPG